MGFFSGFEDVGKLWVDFYVKGDDVLGVNRDDLVDEAGEVTGVNAVVDEASDAYDGFSNTAEIYKDLLLYDKDNKDNFFNKGIVGDLYKAYGADDFLDETMPYATALLATGAAISVGYAAGIGAEAFADYTGFTTTFGVYTDAGFINYTALPGEEEAIYGISGSGYSLMASKDTIKSIFEDKYKPEDSYEEDYSYDDTYGDVTYVQNDSTVSIPTVGVTTQPPVEIGSVVDKKPKEDGTQKSGWSIDPIYDGEIRLPRAYDPMLLGKQQLSLNTTYHMNEWMAGGRLYDAPRAGDLHFNVTGNMNTTKFLGLPYTNLDYMFRAKEGLLGEPYRDLNIQAGSNNFSVI